MEDASPEKLNGFKVMMQLEEHPFNRKFWATITGHKPHPQYDTSRLYILLLDSETVKAIGEREYLLFHPQGVIHYDKDKLLGSLMKKYRTFECRPSMEDLLLNPDCLFSGLLGRVYAPKDPLALNLEPAVLDISLIAYGNVFPHTDQHHSLSFAHGSAS